MSLIKGPAASLIGLILARMVVPLWITAGAVFKLIEHTPRLLPQSVREIGMIKLDIPGYPYLATLIALEFVAVAVMLFIPKFARSAAIFMMSVFCLVLIAELAMGNTSCGCLGAASPHPAVMLGIDGALLLGLILFSHQGSGLRSPLKTGAVVGAAVVALLGAGAAYGVILPLNKQTAPPPTNGNGAGGNGQVVTAPAYDPADPVNTAPVPVPPLYYIGHRNLVEKAEDWEGKPWYQVDLFTYLKRWPKGLDAGERYVIFYSRTCDHCEEMFDFHLSDPNWASKVTAIEVPAGPKVMTDPTAAWPMPPTQCELLSLPLGCDYVITTPLIFKVVDGIVECAHESSHESCMGLESDHEH